MSGDKSEKPTQKKIKESRKKGQVAKSQDMSSGVVFMAGFLMTALVVPGFIDRMRQFMKYCFYDIVVSPTPMVTKAFGVLGKSWALILSITAPVLGTMFVVAIAISYVQVGAIFTFETMKPDFKKLNPVEGFKNIFFKSKTYLELAKSVLKIIVVTVLIYVIVKGNLRYLILTARQSTWETTVFIGDLIYKIGMQTGVFFLVVAAADFFLQKKLFMKQMMMSKEDIKQEHKSSEGDPHHKHQRKQLHREISQHNMVQDVKKAKVVIVNPEHIAVALAYDKDTMNAPQVTAKGQNLWALQIIEIAKQYNVPIMRNIPLAHALHELEIGDEVPESLYQTVAEVLNWVYGLTKK